MKIVKKLHIREALRRGTFMEVTLMIFMVPVRTRPVRVRFFRENFKKREISVFYS
jgi:hypothetical protein